MLRRSLACVTLLAIPLHTAQAQWPLDLCGCAEQACPPEAEIVLEFSRTFTGSYRTGEPHDVWTVDPSGSGETLEEAGIRLRIRLVCTNFTPPRPVAGLAAEEIQLFSSALCSCAGIYASQPTDADGWTEFTGTVRGGGCTDRLMLFVDGVGTAYVPIRVNSADAVPASPCAVDASDLSALAARLGVASLYTICADTNEDGSIDASELSALADVLGARCP